MSSELFYLLVPTEHLAIFAIKLDLAIALFRGQKTYNFVKLMHVVLLGMAFSLGKQVIMFLLSRES